MSVVNCKVAHIRPEYQNLKEWTKDPQNVYIARRGVVFIDKERFPKQASEFANPFKVGKNMTREESLIKYEEYIREKLKKDPSLKKKLLDLKGKNLGCWCYPEKCHGDVLLKLIEEFSNENSKPEPSSSSSSKPKPKLKIRKIKKISLKSKKKPTPKPRPRIKIKRRTRKT